MMTNSSMMLISAGVLAVVVAVIPNVVWGIWSLLALTGVCTRPCYAPFGWTAVGLVLVVWGVMAYGFFVGRFQREVVRTEYRNAAIPVSFDGYKIVHISDLHLSTFNDNPAVLQSVVDSINAQQADVICFTGDLVTFGVAEAEPFAEILRGLHARDGVVSVLGNHDMMIYTQLSPEEQVAEVERLVVFERDVLGWTVLRNDHKEVCRGGERLTIVGVDNSSCGDEGFKTIHTGDLGKALLGTEGFRILLSHDPTHWRAEVVPQTDIPLTLSGHTHSGQIRLFGVPLSRMLFSESAGWYSTEDGRQSLYVNSGIGCTLPVRIACPSEVSVIRLRR